MSVATTSQARHLATSEAPRATPNISTTHTIRWTVSPRALAAVQPELVGADRREDVGMVVRIEIAESDFHASVAIEVGDRTHAVESIRGHAERSHVGACELLHLDSSELVVSLRRSADGYETLYARLPLLSRWGIAGGRYELVP
jgi:hypothetical protein